MAPRDIIAAVSSTAPPPFAEHQHFNHSSVVRLPLTSAYANVAHGALNPRRASHHAVLSAVPGMARRSDPREIIAAVTSIIPPSFAEHQYFTGLGVVRLQFACTNDMHWRGGPNPRKSTAREVAQ